MKASIDDLNGWLIHAGLDGLDQAHLVAGYCERLVETGLPIWRASVGADTLHPLIDAQGHRWVAGEGVLEEFFPRVTTPERLELWHRSPWYWMIEEDRDAMRHRLSDGEGCEQFPLLADLAGQRGVDYWARIISFGERTRLGDLRGLAHLLDFARSGRLLGRRPRADRGDASTFALAFKATMSVDTARTVVGTYLGEADADAPFSADARSIGKVTSVRKVLWLQRPSGFHQDSGHPAAGQLLELLNAPMPTASVQRRSTPRRGGAEVHGRRHSRNRR
ncbi:MAG: hypothetical protein R3F54_26405 [Alphaproteobacteria bacterium]